MRLLHTSDWHIGKNLYGQSRFEEYEKFLDWMIEIINEKLIDTVLISGDIFDTNTPSNKAQELYYSFLSNIGKTQCSNVVIIGGNHDSPTFLDAPKLLLKKFSIHIVGASTGNIQDEIIVLRDKKDVPYAIICAVPYLRDRDIRKVQVGDTIDEISVKMQLGIQEHYKSVFQLAVEKREELNLDLPIIAMGHLYTEGGRVIEGDGVRSLFVGTLAFVDNKAFENSFDYVALGHLHQQQRVNKSEIIRYSGAPLIMSFNENAKDKAVLIAKFQRDQDTQINQKSQKNKASQSNKDKRNYQNDQGGQADRISDSNRFFQCKTEILPVPIFQEIYRIEGDMPAIKNKLEEIKNNEASPWLEIVYKGEEFIPDLRDILEDFAKGSGINILKIKNRAWLGKNQFAIQSMEELSELNEIKVFQALLDKTDLNESSKSELVKTYEQALILFREDDQKA